MAAQDKIKCTFPDCFQHFTSIKAMKKHKKHSQEHDYCHICDKDFEDWDQYSAHNALYSGRDAQGKSIAQYINADEVRPNGNELHMFGCAKCGKLFGTESGRERHTEGAHPIDQNIQCPGCPEIFPRAAGLIFHIEEGLCKGITAAQFKGHLQHKNLVSRLLQDPKVMETLASKDYNSYLEAAEDEEKGGGVMLDSEDIIWDEDNEPPKPLIPEKPMVPPRMPVHQKMWPELSEANPGNGVSLLAKDINNLSMDKKKGESSKPGVCKLNVEAWPLPGGWKKGDPMPEPPKAWALATSKDATKPEPLRTHWEDMSSAIVQSNRKTNLLHYNTKNPVYKELERFYNPLIEKYECPVSSCSEYFDTATENQEHLETAHPTDQRRCPRCQKWFRSYSALISHCEAPNSRCGISYSDGFGKVIHEYSGGFLKAEPVARPDLTLKKDGYRLNYMKYEASVPQGLDMEIEGVTIGTKLN